MDRVNDASRTRWVLIVLASLVLLSVGSSGGVAAGASDGPRFLSIGGIDLQLGRGLLEYAYAANVDMTAHVSRELRHIQQVLHAPRTKVTAELGASVVPATGVGGGTDPRNGAVSVTVALRDRAAFRTALLVRVPVTMAHELSHAKRILVAGKCWAATRTTLAEALVCEGLGDAFARQIYPERKTPHSDALTPAEEERMWKRIEPKLDAPLPPERFFEWFTSGGRNGIPHWTGYTIGFRIVRSYLRAHPGVTAAEVTLMDADELIENSGYDGA